MEILIISVVLALILSAIEQFKSRIMSISFLSQFVRKTFGVWLTWTTFIIFLILLVYAIILFTQNFPLQKSSSSTASPRVTPALNVNIFIFSDLFESFSKTPTSSSSISARVSTSPSETQTAQPSDLLDYLDKLLRVFGLLILLGMLALVLHWLSSRRGGIVILPFDVDTENLSGNNEQTSNKPQNQKHYNGKAIADLLIQELHRIRHIYALPQELEKDSTDEINLRLGNINFPPLTCIPDQLGDVLTEVATVEVGKTKLSIGRLLLNLRKIWPFGGVEGIVTGSIQTYGQLTCIIARIEYENKISAWEVKRKINSTESIPQEMIRELAYKVAFEIIPKDRLPAETWKAFREITKAILHYMKYFRTKLSTELYKTDQCLQKVKKYDYVLVKQGNKKSELLADFFYKISISYLLNNQKNQAKKALEYALETDPKWDNYYYYYNGLGNVYWKLDNSDEAIFQYKRSLNIIKKLRKKTVFPYPYNGLGNIYSELREYRKAIKYYNRAIQENNKFWKPYHNLGNIYLYSLHDNKLFENVCHCNLAIKKFKKAIELSNNKSASSHSGLGLAYLFKVIALSKQRIWFFVSQRYLEKALNEAQVAIELDRENATSYWNLGLIKLWKVTIIDEVQKQKSILDEVQRIWKIAADKARQQERHLCWAIYTYVEQSLSPCKFLPSSSYLESVKKCLEQQSKQGSIEIIIQDLEVIQELLVRYKSYIHDWDNVNQLDQRIFRAEQNITNLRKELKNFIFF